MKPDISVFCRGVERSIQNPLRSFHVPSLALVLPIVEVTKTRLPEEKEAIMMRPVIYVSGMSSLSKGVLEILVQYLLLVYSRPSVVQRQGQL